ncbi:MAG: peptidoglycan DD-metalloendopeptidase family protein [Firmicutes bacterium]|nr:peptidoglycan DD-metalloendopeptidase family protein [Bacillota bacterium]
MYQIKGYAAALLVVFLFCSMVIPLAASTQMVLRPGMRGIEVKALQAALRGVGFHLEADGIYGPETTKTVQEFQRRQGLQVDGLAGPATREALEKLAESEENLIHIVRRGESLSVLAQRYNVPLGLLVEANDLVSSKIIIGQELMIPRALPAQSHPSRIDYTVQGKDTLSAIARRFNTTVPELLGCNHLPNPDRLQIGQKIIIPIQGATSRLPMVWPVRGRIASGYGWRIHPVYGRKHFHGGIDIAAPSGTPVRAAAPGLVSRTGWMGGGGLVVVIDHGSGITTWYLHNSRVLVRKGQRVRGGDVIARSGATGVVTGPHVDFRIKINDRTIDPMAWLP